MIEGVVNSDREAVITIRVWGENGREQEFVAIVDTGFTGSLTLPPDVIERLRLAWMEMGEAVLGDGNEVAFDVYSVNVLWDGELISIAVDESDSVPLVGMELMEGFHISIEDKDGGSVKIEKMEGR